MNRNDIHPSSLSLHPSSNPPSFIYFDLGKVILDFSYQAMIERIAEMLGGQPLEVIAALEQDHLIDRYETGEIETEAFHDTLCAQFPNDPQQADVVRAASDIFRPILPMIPIITALRAARVPIGLLSNTCDIHWQFVCAKYPGIVGNFDVYTLSHQVTARKPQPEIYRAAAERAGVAPEQIFFTDDLTDNIEGARSFGFDAVLFQSPQQIRQELRRRGIPGI